MVEKFKIDISTFQCVGGVHYYGRVRIPLARQQDGYPGGHYHELEHAIPGVISRTIRFDTIGEIIAAAKKWFLIDVRVLPGDKLVIWTGYWKERKTKLEKPDWCATEA